MLLSIHPRRLAVLEIFQPNTASGPDAFAGLLDAAEEARVILQPVIEPVVFRGEPDQHAGGLAMTRDDDVAFLGFAQEMREVVLHLGQRDFLHAGLANWASH